jgi:hypothetical protein
MVQWGIRNLGSIATHQQNGLDSASQQRNASRSLGDGEDGIYCEREREEKATGRKRKENMREKGKKKKKREEEAGKKTEQWRERKGRRRGKKLSEEKKKENMREREKVCLIN